VAEVFQLKHANPADVARVLQVFTGHVDAQPDLKVVMWKGPAEIAPAVRDVVQRLDVPPAAVTSIDLTFYLLSGSKQPGSAAALPSELEGVATQVKKIFGLSRLSLLETAALRVRDGSGGKIEGVVPGLSDPSHQATYALEFGPTSLTSGEHGALIRLDRLALRLRVPSVDKSSGGRSVSVNLGESWLRTDAEVPEGQKVVLGKATVDDSGDTFFLVVTAKVVS
jgi:hypothetical protein